MADPGRLIWYRLPNGTDLWQPVGAGCAQVLKELIGVKQPEWLVCDYNAARWSCHKNHFTAKKRESQKRGGKGKCGKNCNAASMINCECVPRKKQVLSSLPMEQMTTSSSLRGFPFNQFHHHFHWTLQIKFLQTNHLQQSTKLTMKDLKYLNWMINENFTWMKLMRTRQIFWMVTYLPSWETQNV